GQHFDDMWSIVRKFGAERLPGRTLENMKTAFQHYPTLLALETGIEQLGSQKKQQEEQLESQKKQLEEATHVVDKIDERVAGNRYLATIVAMINGHWIGLEPTLVVKASKDFILHLSNYVSAQPYFKKHTPSLEYYLNSISRLLVLESISIGLQSR
ncbi:hypothetical protein MUO56_02845, partial [Candidatus Bathyarchaeota archaeon]|nr:hypothetical protein [Candidatus Bathyarchaeota archaeon]